MAHPTVEQSSTSNHDPVVIVSGLRTPFLKKSTGFSQMSTLQLASALVNELIVRTGVPPSTYTACVFGQATVSLDYLNLAREVVFRTLLQNQTVVAHSVSQACLTGMQAITSAIHAIQNGEHDAVIAGGADNIDDIPAVATPKLKAALEKLNHASSSVEKARILASLSPKDWMPVAPGFAVEPTTGLSMGQHCELMAKDWNISRVEQDTIAHNSHIHASSAWENGFYTDHVMPIAVVAGHDAVAQDNLVRYHSNFQDYASLPTIFDSEFGTITAASSSPLSAGAAAVTLMRKSKAISLGLTPLGRIRSWCYTAVAPMEHLLMAPVSAIPQALNKAGLTLPNIDFVELHEAFAAQVACTLKALNSKKYCCDILGLPAPVGELEPSTINPNGGSIALGHPFGATGVRVIVQALKQLRKTNRQFALIGICAGGGLGAAAVLEAE